MTNGELDTLHSNLTQAIRSLQRFQDIAPATLADLDAQASEIGRLMEENRALRDAAHKQVETIRGLQAEVDCLKQCAAPAAPQGRRLERWCAVNKSTGEVPVGFFGVEESDFGHTLNSDHECRPCTIIVHDPPPEPEKPKQADLHDLRALARQLATDERPVYSAWVNRAADELESRRAAESELNERLREAQISTIQGEPCAVRGE